MENMPKHIAIIMDGNRRWAKSKGLPVKIGHKEGAETLKKITRHANKLGIEYLTVFAFSMDNWKRSEEEVGALMVLFKNYLNDLVTAVDTENVRVKVIGHIETLPDNLRDGIKCAMDKTKDNTGTTLSIAFNYKGTDEIVKAVKEIAEDVSSNKISIDDINENLVQSHLYTKDEPNPDLLIRTSGEIRTSNFMQWQIAYSEFVFLDKYWPDFCEKDLEEAIDTYGKRSRRFGGK